MAGAEWTGRAADKTLKSAGLNKDFASVKVRNSAGDTWEIRLSKQKSGDDFVASVSGGGHGPAIVTVSAATAAGLRKRKSDLTGPPTAEPQAAPEGLPR